MKILDQFQKAQNKIYALGTRRSWRHSSRALYISKFTYRKNHAWGRPPVLDENDGIVLLAFGPNNLGGGGTAKPLASPIEASYFSNFVWQAKYNMLEYASPF